MNNLSLKINQYLIEAAIPEWFNKLSPEAQKQYFIDHPKSKITRQLKPKEAPIEENAPTRQRKAIKELQNRVGRIIVDNPGGKWLEDQQTYADEKANELKAKGQTDGFGPHSMFGSVTCDIPRIMLPPQYVLKLKGLMHEELTRGQYGNPKADALRQSMKEHGFMGADDGTGDITDNTIFVTVNHHGDAFIAEGNNRAAVAGDLRIKAIPVNVRYFNGGEQVDGSFSPENLLKTVKELPAIIVKNFVLDNSHILGYPYAAFNTCKEMSFALDKELREAGQDSVVLQAQGSKIDYKDTVEGWQEIPKKDWIHYAVLLNKKYVIDLSIRQFDPYARYPRIKEIDQFKQEWDNVYELGDNLPPGVLVQA